MTKKVTKYVCNGSDMRIVGNTNMNQNIPNIQNLEMLVSNTHNYGISVGLDNDVGSLTSDVSDLESESKSGIFQKKTALFLLCSVLFSS